MSKVKIKQLTNNKNSILELGNLFNNDTPEKYIIIPKYIKIKQTCMHIITILRKMAEFKLLIQDFPSIVKGMNEIKAWTNKVEKDLHLDVKETESSLDALPKPELFELYKTLKNHNLLKAIILHCNELKPFEVLLEKLDGSFILKEVGNEYYIFPFSTFDIKTLWLDQNAKPAVKKFILSVLLAYYKDARNLYELIVSPDIDIDMFIEKILSSLSSIQSTSAGARCKKAFSKINESIQVFKQNFLKYYRDSVVAKNSQLIAINFVTDISQQSADDFDIELARQFKVIISQLHQAGEKNGKNKDPKVIQMYEKLNKTFSFMEKATRANNDEAKKYIEEAFGNNLTNLTDDKPITEESKKEIAEMFKQFDKIREEYENKDDQQDQEKKHNKEQNHEQNHPEIREQISQEQSSQEIHQGNHEQNRQEQRLEIREQISQEQNNLEQNHQENHE